MAPPRKAPQVPGDTPADALPDVASAQADTPADVPGVLRAADVDPTTLTRAVLTADGWVCPA